MFRKEDYLDPEHWQFRDYTQRMETKTWKKFVFAGVDKIIYQGRVYRLVAKKLGYGIVEISKKELNS